MSKAPIIAGIATAAIWLLLLLTPIGPFIALFGSALMQLPAYILFGDLGGQTNIVLSLMIFVLPVFIGSVLLGHYGIRREQAAIASLGVISGVSCAGFAFLIFLGMAAWESASL